MAEARYASSGHAGSAGPWIVVAIIAVIVVGSHVLAVHRCTLPVYGYGGAEYIEHETRAQVAAKMAEIPLPLVPLSLPGLFQSTDAAYPSGLPICAAVWGAIFGGGILSAVHLNLLFLVLLALGVASATRNLPTVVGRDPSSWWASALAAASLLLTPTFFGSARRYYYDLPMAAWITLAFAALCRFPLSPMAIAVGTVASALALLTKWNAGFSLAPLWLLAAIVTARDPMARRRWRTIRHLAAGAVMVVVLCSPVLVNSTMVRSVLVPAVEGVGLEAGWLKAPQASSFDISFGQSHAPTPGGRGLDASAVLSRVQFYGARLVKSVLGPLVAVALLAVVAVGWRAWREPILAAALCAPTLLVLASPAVTILDERFIQPCIPMLLAGCWIMWDSSRWRTPPAIAAGVLVLAGVVQLAAWDGHLPLGPAWTGQSSEANRGWSRLADTECSPHDSYESLAAAACESSWNGGGVLVARTACHHMGIRWMLDKACPEVGYRCLPDEEAAERAAAAASEPGRRHPASIVVPVDLAQAGWPAPIHEIWMPEDSQNPETLMGLYLFEPTAHHAATELR